MFRSRRPRPVEPQAESPLEPEPLSVEGGGEVLTVTDETFLALTEGAFTVVDFWAAWCGPCKQFGPLFESVARAHAGPVRFGKCDVDANPQTAALLQIRSIPTLVVFGPDGSEVGRSTGAVSRGDLEATVRQLSTR